MYLFKQRQRRRLTALYDYSFLQWMLIFYIYCFLGWCFESTVVSVQQRRFVNRGFLRGPMLPIYGFGATMLLHIALPLAGYPVWMFLASMLSATAFEYVVGVVMEKLFKVKYWDYSTHRFQFQGRICLQSSVCWGAMGLFLSNFIHPPIEKLIIAMPFWLLLTLVILLSGSFASDVGVSVRTALDLARVLVEMDKLREQADEVRRELSRTAFVKLTNLSYRVDEARGEWSERVGDAKEQLSDVKDQLYDKVDDAKEQLSDAKEQLLDRLDDLQSRFEQAAGALKNTRKSLLRGNPSARSEKYDAVLQKLKRHVDPRKRG